MEELLPQKEEMVSQTSMASNTPQPIVSYLHSQASIKWPKNIIIVFHEFPKKIPTLTTNYSNSTTTKWELETYNSMMLVLWILNHIFMKIYYMNMDYVRTCTYKFLVIKSTMTFDFQYDSFVQPPRSSDHEG